MVSLGPAVEAMIRRGALAEGLIALEKPELRNLFLTYQNEAVAARKFLQSSLIELDPGSEILEVGGVFLRSQFNWQAKDLRSQQLNL